MTVLAVMIPYMAYSPFACVYKIHLGRGYFYIGSTVNLGERIDGHISSIKKGKRDITEYTHLVSGNHTISFEILEEIKNVLTLTDREQYFLDMNKGDKYCVNICKVTSMNMAVKRMLEAG